MSRNRLLLLVAVMSSVLVALGGLFLGVQPQLTSAQSSDEQRSTAEANNAAAQRRIAQLREENESLPRQKAELAVLEGSIPSSLNQSAFYRELYDLAGASGVTISSLTTSDAQAYTPPQSAVESTASSSPSASATPSPSASPSTPSAPAAKTNPAITSANFSAVPVSVGVKGSFEQAIAYMKAVQNGKRLFLVSSIVSSSSSSTGSDAGTAAGPTTWTLSGFIYVLQDVSATQAEQSASKG